MIGRAENSINPKNNSFNLIRLIGAFNVMFVHTTHHMAIYIPNNLRAPITFFEGVPIFYVLSGFLIWISLSNGRSSSFKDYGWKRFLRIYPELWIAVLIEIITIIALYGAKINWFKMVLFAIAQGTIFQFWTPSFLRGYGCGVPNGSLGTISELVQCYVIIWILFLFLRNKKIYWWIILFSISILISANAPLLQSFMPSIVYKLFMATCITYFWMFFMGAFIAEYFDKVVPVLMRIWPILLCASFLFFTFPKYDVIVRYHFFRSVFLTIGLIGFAYAIPKLNISFDISYGIYLYHMIIVNIMITIGVMNSLWSMIITFAISIVLAWISTRYIGQNEYIVYLKKQHIHL